jgi:hypothetical protein
VVPRSRDKRRDDIAIAVAEGHDLIALDLLVSVEADVVATLFRSRCRAISVDDGHVEEAALVEPQYHDRENDIETATGLPPSKGAINPGVVDLGAPLGVLCNRQLLPLTSQVQQFQDVVEQGMQGQLRRGRGVQRSGAVRQIVGTAPGSVRSECSGTARFWPS